MTHQMSSAFPRLKRPSQTFMNSMLCGTGSDGTQLAHGH